MPRKKVTKNRSNKRRHVLDVKLRSSQRRQTRLRRVGLLLLFLAGLGLGGYTLREGGRGLLQRFIYENPAFAIDTLEIETDGVLSVEQLRRWAGVRANANLFSLNLERVQRDLELVPLIRSATVERVLPHTLRISVSERQAMGEVHFRRASGTMRYLLDAEGCVMFPLSSYLLRPGARPDVRYPSLVGVRSTDLQPGYPARSEQVMAALKLIELFNRSPMVGLARIELISLKSPGLLTVTTDTDAEVTFSVEDIGTQLTRWRAVYNHGVSEGLVLASLDLSVANNLPARWQRAEEPVRRGGRATTPGRRRV